MSERKNVYLCLLLLALLPLWHLIYALRTGLYFSQDDFAVFAYFKQYDAWELLVRFLTKGDIWGFHKVIGFMNMRALFEFFGTNHYVYLLNNHLIHTVNILLLFLLLYRLSNDYLRALFFGIVFNKIYLFYFSNVHEYLVVTFILLTTYVYFFSKNKFLAVILFAMALLTKEVAFTLPFLLFALEFYKNGRRNLGQLTPFFVVLLIYVIYQLNFLTNKIGLPADHPYLICLTWSCWSSNFSFYISNLLVILLAATLYSGVLRKSILILVVFILSLLPAVLLQSRHEGYYFYLPLMYLCIYFCLSLPRVELRSLVLYVGVFWAMGGRSILPIVVWRDYINWQRISIDRVLYIVEKESYMAPTIIDFSTTPLERDAEHLLGSNIVEFFLKRELAEKYVYEYDVDKRLLVVGLKK